MAEERGWTQLAGMPKHRYVYILGTKKQKRIRTRLLRWPILPYPKKEELESYSDD